MRYIEIRRLFRGVAAAGALAMAGAFAPHVLGAQEVGEPDFVQETDAGDASDWGWLGLLGLAGLLGLRRRDREVHRVDTTTSHRP